MCKDSRPTGKSRRMLRAARELEAAHQEMIRLLAHSPTLDAKTREKLINSLGDAALARSRYLRIYLEHE